MNEYLLVRKCFAVSGFLGAGIGGIEISILAGLAEIGVTVASSGLGSIATVREQCLATVLKRKNGGPRVPRPGGALVKANGPALAKRPGPAVARTGNGPTGVRTFAKTTNAAVGRALSAGTLGRQ